MKEKFEDCKRQLNQLEKDIQMLSKNIIIYRVINGTNTSFTALVLFAISRKFITASLFQFIVINPKVHVFNIFINTSVSKTFILFARLIFTMVIKRQFIGSNEQTNQELIILSDFLCR